MTEQEVIDIFQKRGAILKGHFELSSGRHSRIYVQCAKIFESPKLTKALAKELASPYQKEKIDLVIAPAVGAIILGYALAQVINCRLIFTERIEGKMVLRREFSVLPGEKALVAEDVVTTGRTAKELIEVVKSRKGGVAGVVCLVDRGGKKVFQEALFSLAKIEAQSYSPRECPLCHEELPLYSPGSRGCKEKF